jgi:sugar O-acyltransferase (sialic acid O-acetyltransferase NeuD family)
MTKRLLIFPFGGNGREALVSVIDMNRIRGEWDVVGFVDDDEELRDRECCGVRVIGGREVIKDYPDAYVLAVPGNPDNFTRRGDIIEGLSVARARFATVVHSSAVISPDSRIGINTLLMPNVFVGPGAEIGNHCIILPNTVVSHDSKVGDYSCVGSNVSLSGNSRVGRSCYIGSGAKIRGNISIGERVMIGLGANVISDIHANVVAVGNPARVIKEITE